MVMMEFWGMVESAYTICCSFLAFFSKPNMLPEPLNQSEDTADTLSSNQNKVDQRKSNSNVIFTLSHLQKMDPLNLVILEKAQQQLCTFQSSTHWAIYKKNGSPKSSNPGEGPY